MTEKEKEKEIVEVVIKVTQSNGKELYEVIGRRSNYVEITAPDISTIQKELEKVIGFCKVLKTPSEILEQQKERLLEFVIKNSTNEQKARNPEFFRPWRLGEPFTKDEYANHLGLVFLCQEDNIATYENIPINNPKIWKIVPEDKPKEQGINPEWQEHYEKAEFYYDDLSYPAGVYKKHYNELYKSKEKVPAGKTPKDNPQFWKLIPKIKIDK